MEENTNTTAELLDAQIKETLDDLEIARFARDDSAKPILEKLKVLHTQQLEIQKLEQQTTQKKQELELELQKFETETAIKIRELELKEKESKTNAANEEQKLEEQKKANVTNAVLGGVTAATGIASIWQRFTVLRSRCSSKRLGVTPTKRVRLLAVCSICSAGGDPERARVLCTGS